MKLSIDNIEINLCPVTQLCGQNMMVKGKLFNDIERYFSSEKIDDDEFERISAKLDGETVGRKHFMCLRVDQKEDLLDAIKLTKNSFLTTYIHNKLTDLPFQTELFEIEKSLTVMYSYLNENLFSDIGSLELDYSLADVFEMVQKGSSVTEESYSGKSNLELFDIWINLLLQALNVQPEKIMVLLPELDHLLTIDDYKIAIPYMQRAAEQHDICFVVGTSLYGYVAVSSMTFKGICVFNDEYFQFESPSILTDFIETHYPFLKEWTEAEIYLFLPRIIQMIGKRSSVTEVRQEVILKLINESLMIHECKCIDENLEEQRFLHIKNVL